ncbi:AAMP-like protein [Mya arenaria]|uniref:AAMP-like protein n=1 Tax=Mya arenaria TaxID=6604 RepID=A0ABY7END0_MYAAR|nr:AAMP-like protein [Mya arenaria]
MSGNENSGDGEFDDVINAEDILHVIELDDNRDISEVMEEADLGEDFDDDMEASGGQIEVQDMAGVVFDKHKDAVFSVHIDPNTSQLAVTGGQDDTAHDGTYVATADLSGLVKVWKIETKEDVFTFECSDAEWMKWHPGSHVLFLGTVDGDIWMWKIPSGECKTLQSHGCTVSCGVILSDGVNAHKSTVLCVDTHPVNNVILSGSTDVTARAYNSSTGKREKEAND